MSICFGLFWELNRNLICLVLKGIEPFFVEITFKKKHVCSKAVEKNYYNQNSAFGHS